MNRLFTFFVLVLSSLTATASGNNTLKAGDRLQCEFTETSKRIVGEGLTGNELFIGHFYSVEVFELQGNGKIESVKVIENTMQTAFIPYGGIDRTQPGVDLERIVTNSVKDSDSDGILKNSVIETNSSLIISETADLAYIGGYGGGPYNLKLDQTFTIDKQQLTAKLKFRKKYSNSRNSIGENLRHDLEYACRKIQ